VSSIPGADDFNWILGPPGRCVSFIAEETRIGALLQRAIVVLGGFQPFLRLIRPLFERDPDALARLEWLMKEQEGLGQWAKELSAGDFSPINSHALVGLWTAIEVAVEDTVSLIILKDPTVLPLALEMGASKKLFSAPALDAVAARRMYSRWEGHLRDTLSIGAAYDALLGALLPFPSNVDRAIVLTELNYVRNCILHRGGTVDEKVLGEAPYLGVKSGDQVVVASKSYLRYFDAAATFASDLIGAAVKSKYTRAREPGERDGAS
jgi:hypothetical protein